MSTFDPQCLHDLEFHTLREWLAGFAIGSTVHNRLLELEPSVKFDQVKLELFRVKEFHLIRISGESFPALDYEELYRELRLLPVRNAVLEQEGFVRIRRASELMNAILYFFDKRESDFPQLAHIVANAYYTDELIKAIEQVFDRNGAVRNEASPLLFQIRQKIQLVRQQINRNFEREMRKLLKDGLLADTREAFVNERRVLSVMSTHKRKVAGSVAGSSKTGSLTFIEPAVNIELNNELEMLIDDERKEIFRILQELTREMAKHSELIQAYQAILGELDFISAKTKLALELHADLPSLMDEPYIELIEAYHPILWRNNKLMGKKTMPQSIRMDKFSRMLVISGPNAGGKSITLKTIGLLQLMLQAGLLIPCHANSKMSLFQHVLTDIGDNQSIENELSTYSYRLKRMKHFLETANRRSLLLLDEFGTGSDPDLGGALAEVFFEELYNKKCFGVITTHYNNIKLKADRLKNACNGCMLFNADTLEPLYKFSIGQPGSSFTFEVAQINGIPMELIELAKGKIDQGRVNLDKLLNELQQEKNYLEQLNREHREAQALAEEARLNYLNQKQRLDDKLAAQAKLMEANNQFVLAGKKMKNFIDRFQGKSRKKDINQPLLEEIRKYLVVEKGKLDDQAQKLKVQQQSHKKSKKKVLKPEQDPHQRDKIVLGSTVKLIETKQSGTVEEVNGNLLTVTFGFLRMKVEREKLSFIK